METSLTRTIVWRNRAAVSLILQSIADIVYAVSPFSSDSISKLHQGTCAAALNHGIAVPHSCGTSHLIPLNPPRWPPKIDKRRYDILPHQQKTWWSRFPHSTKKYQANRSSQWSYNSLTANREDQFQSFSACRDLGMQIYSGVRPASFCVYTKSRRHSTRSAVCAITIAQ
jgi:hypothetical protein